MLSTALLVVVVSISRPDLHDSRVEWLHDDNDTLQRHQGQLVLLRVGPKVVCASAQDVIQALLVGIAKVAPEGALSALLADVLAEPTNWDTTLAGLQALLVILFQGPKQSSSRASLEPEVGQPTRHASASPRPCHFALSTTALPRVSVDDINVDAGTRYHPAPLVSSAAQQRA